MLVDFERITTNHQPTVLLAEDDPNDELLLRLAFTKVAPQVSLRTFADGEILMRFLRSETHAARVPELLILDLKMPKLDGFSVLGWLLDHPKSRPNHVAVLTGMERQDDLTKALDMGVDFYLIKPQDSSRLQNLVHSLSGCWGCGGKPAKAAALPARSSRNFASTPISLSKADHGPRQVETPVSLKADVIEL